jgi:hypothetical protein
MQAKIEVCLALATDGCGEVEHDVRLGQGRQRRQLIRVDGAQVYDNTVESPIAEFLGGQRDLVEQGDAGDRMSWTAEERDISPVKDGLSEATAEEASTASDDNVHLSPPEHRLYHGPAR